MATDRKFCIHANFSEFCKTSHGHRQISPHIISLFYRNYWGFIFFAIFLAVLESGLSNVRIANAESLPNIIPSPKNIQTQDRRIILSSPGQNSAVICALRADIKDGAAVGIINKRIAALGNRKLPFQLLTQRKQITKGKCPIVLLVNPLDQPPAELERVAFSMRKKISARCAQAYAIQCFTDSNGRDYVLLYANSPSGLIYAAITFAKLLQYDGEQLHTQAVNIIDWPDFKFRALPVWPMPANLKAFKRAIDWAVRYKFNGIFTNPSLKRKANKFDLPTAEERQYLRQANEYAAERGMKITYMLDWSVGSSDENSNDPNFKDAVQFGGLYYTWSLDKLLMARARKLVEFVQDTNATSLNLHCIDTFNENWLQRKTPDRLRFGNDRAAADAHVINTFTKALRSFAPEIELQFVVYPYQINFSLQENYNFRQWISRLSMLIPPDVYLCRTEHSYEQAASWVSLVRQPIVHWINGNAFQWGRYFTTSPCFTRSSYFPGRHNDMIYNAEPIGLFKGEVMQAVAAEYAWNVHAQGSRLMIENSSCALHVTGGMKYFRDRTVDGAEYDQWSWYHATDSPHEVVAWALSRACISEYGDALGKAMVPFFSNNPIGGRGSENFFQRLNPLRHVDKRNATALQLQRTDKAIAALNSAILKAAAHSSQKKSINRFLKNTLNQKLIIMGAQHRFLSMHAQSNGDLAEAERQAKEGLKKLCAYKSELECAGAWNKKSEQWSSDAREALKEILKGIRLKRLKVENLIPNSGFEHVGQHSAWNYKHSSEKLTRDSLSGSYAAVLELQPTKPFAQMSYTFKAPAGKNCYLEFWVKKQNRARMIPSLVFRDSRGNIIERKLVLGHLSPIVEVNNFEMIATEFWVPIKSMNVTFDIHLDWFGASPIIPVSLIVDDVYLFRAPEIAQH